MNLPSYRHVPLNGLVPHADDENAAVEEEFKKRAAECREFVNMACYRITNNIRDILFEKRHR